ncbi:MAG: hypothetical protein K6F82_01285 [Sphaerochaetaceae bacterium]|nr:hypothetical protein [Sphaerochaetaceae bacterium]
MHKKNCFLIIFLALFILLSSSCEKDDLVITSSLVEPYLIREENRMGLSLYILSSEENLKEMRITSPDGSLSWTTGINTVKYKGIKYSGTSNIAMPQNTDLPAGEWNLDLVSSDGRVCNYSFKVTWSDKAGALERTESGYDEISNLTVI